jgi:hypothetical protein
VRNNRLSIQILKPVAEVFEYTLNPKNTPKWISSIIAEQVSEWPPKIGSIYKNQNKAGEWAQYEVTNLIPSQIFELMSPDGVYHRRYSYKPLADYKCEIEYFEWHDTDELAEPFKQEYLNKLKRLAEGV